MSTPGLDYYRRVQQSITARRGVSAQLQAHALLELSLHAMHDGRLPTARPRELSRWLNIPTQTAKRIISALTESGLVRDMGDGSLVLPMCDSVVKTERQVQNVGKTEREIHPHVGKVERQVQNVGKIEREIQNVVKTEREIQPPALSDNVLNPRTYSVGTRESAHVRAHTREAFALASTPDLSGLDASEAQIALADYHRVFEHGLGLSLSPQKQSFVLRSCAEHGVKTVIKAIREFEAEMLDAREDPTRPAWSWDRTKRSVPLHVLAERIEKTKHAAIAVAHKPSRRPNGRSRGYSNDIWAEALAEGERDQNKPATETTNWREIKSCP